MGEIQIIKTAGLGISPLNWKMEGDTQQKQLTGKGSLRGRRVVVKMEYETKGSSSLYGKGNIDVAERIGQIFEKMNCDELGYFALHGSLEGVEGSILSDTEKQELLALNERANLALHYSELTDDVVEVYQESAHGMVEDLEAFNEEFFRDIQKLSGVIRYSSLEEIQETLEVLGGR